MKKKFERKENCSINDILAKVPSEPSLTTIAALNSIYDEPYQDAIDKAIYQFITSGKIEIEEPSFEKYKNLKMAHCDMTMEEIHNYGLKRERLNNLMRSLIETLDEQGLLEEYKKQLEEHKKTR